MIIKFKELNGMVKKDMTAAQKKERLEFQNNHDCNV
jgi:hypothetical protein